MSTTIEKVILAIQDRDLIGKPLSHKVRDEISDLCKVGKQRVVGIKNVLDHGDIDIIEEMAKERVTVSEAVRSLDDTVPDHTETVPDHTETVPDTVRPKETVPEPEPGNPLKDRENVEEKHLRDIVSPDRDINKDVCPLYIDHHVLNHWGSCPCGYEKKD